MRLYLCKVERHKNIDIFTMFHFIKVSYDFTVRETNIVISIYSKIYLINKWNTTVKYIFRKCADIEKSLETRIMPGFLLPLTSRVTGGDSRFLHRWFVFSLYWRYLLPSLRNWWKLYYERDCSFIFICLHDLV